MNIVMCKSAKRAMNAQKKNYIEIYNFNYFDCGLFVIMKI